MRYASMCASPIHSILSPQSSVLHPLCTPYGTHQTIDFAQLLRAGASFARPWLSHQKSLQLIIPTLNYHGPFDRRSEQLYRRHRGDPSGGRVGSCTIYLPRFQNFIQYTPYAILSSREERLLPVSPFDHYSSCSIFRDRTARIALLSRLKGIEGREQKVCGNSWQVSAVRVSRSPCGPKKNCSTIAFGSRALKISSICWPAPRNTVKQRRTSLQAKSCLHQWCIRPPSPSSHVLRCGCQDPSPNIWR
jgi:hypothetical protein